MFIFIQHNGSYYGGFVRAAPIEEINAANQMRLYIRIYDCEKTINTNEAINIYINHHEMTVVFN